MYYAFFTAILSILCNLILCLWESLQIAIISYLQSKSSIQNMCMYDYIHHILSLFFLLTIPSPCFSPTVSPILFLSFSLPPLSLSLFLSLSLSLSLSPSLSLSLSPSLSLSLPLPLSLVVCSSQIFCSMDRLGQVKHQPSLLLPGNSLGKFH